VAIIRRGWALYCVHCDLPKMWTEEKAEEGEQFCGRCCHRLTKGVITIFKYCSLEKNHDPYIMTVGETEIERQRTCETPGCGAVLVYDKSFMPMSVPPNAA